MEGRERIKSTEKIKFYAFASLPEMTQEKKKKGIKTENPSDTLFMPMVVLGLF